MATARKLKSAVVRIRQRSQHRARRPLRTLPWWVVLLGVGGVAISVWITTAILLAEADVNSPNIIEVAKLRSEAIRTGLTVGAGAAGAFALLLAMRRQWLSERAQKHQEEVSAVTELYAKAVEQLGSDKAPVRLAGLYALERLADDHPAQRQTIVNVMCAYLRMPYASPVEPEEIEGERGEADRNLKQEYREGRQELEVRVTAQRILANHLRQSSGPSVLLWDDIDLDLNHATLLSADFHDCRLRNADFSYVEFHGGANFLRADFRGNATFAEATFYVEGEFSQTVFAGDVWFDAATFVGSASFGEASIAGVACFSQARFQGTSYLTGITVDGETWFDRAAAFDIVRLTGSRFHKDVDFSHADFHEDLWIDEVTFKGAVHLLSVHARLATFDNSVFMGIVRFKGAEFIELSLSGAEFYGSTRLHGIKFTTIALDECRLYGPPEVHSVPWQLELWSGQDYSSVVASASAPSSLTILPGDKPLPAS